MINNLTPDGSLGSSTALPETRQWLMGHPSPFFTGQSAYIDRLKTHFSRRIAGEPVQRRSFLLYGMGGIGKTQICLKFAEECSEQYVFLLL